MRKAWPMFLSAVLLATPATARVQEASEQPALVHGFGSASYGKTDGNRYTVGREEGSYRNSEFALAVRASLTQKLHVSTQVFFKQEQDRGGFDTELDYAFVEWVFSDSLKLHTGRGRQPFGLYTEIFDVGTLRPFVKLPQAVYGPAGVVSEGYDGAGFTGRFNLKGRWALQYDVYGGGMELEPYDPAPALPGEPEEHEDVEAIRNVLGARAIVETPIGGLAFGASAYTGNEENGRHSAYGFQVEYLAGRWSLRGEYVRLDDTGELRSKAFYLEAARRFGPHWQAAARYDWSDTKTSAPAALDPSFGRQRDAALGLNYWVDPGFVLKLSYHRVDGNRFARPEPAELAAAIAAKTVRPRTNLVVVGAQFSF